MYNYQTPVYKNCPNCDGKGFNYRNRSRTRWDAFTKRYQLVVQQQKQKCDKCKGTRRVIDPKGEQQRLKKKKIAQQEQQKKRQYHQFVNKEKKFIQYARQNEIKQPLLQNIQQQQNFIKIKTQAQLRAQFQKKYTEQQQQIKRILRQQQQKLILENMIARVQAQNKRKKEKQEDELRLQQFLKSPQGIEFLKNQQIKRQQQEIEKQKRMKKYRRQNNRKLFVKICCCGSCCNGIQIWGGILFMIGIWIYLAQM